MLRIQIWRNANKPNHLWYGKKILFHSVRKKHTHRPQPSSILRNAIIFDVVVFFLRYDSKFFGIFVFFFVGQTKKCICTGCLTIMNANMLTLLKFFSYEIAIVAGAFNVLFFSSPNIDAQFYIFFFGICYSIWLACWKWFPDSKSIWHFPFHLSGITHRIHFQCFIPFSVMPYNVPQRTAHSKYIWYVLVLYIYIPELRLTYFSRKSFIISWNMSFRPLFYGALVFFPFRLVNY